MISAHAPLLSSSDIRTYFPALISMSTTSPTRRTNRMEVDLLSFKSRLRAEVVHVRGGEIVPREPRRRGVEVAFGVDLVLGRSVGAAAHVIMSSVHSCPASDYRGARCWRDPQTPANAKVALALVTDDRVRAF